MKVQLLIFSLFIILAQGYTQTSQKYNQDDWSIEYPEQWTLKAGANLKEPNSLFKLFPPGPEEAWKPVMKAVIGEPVNNRTLDQILTDHMALLQTTILGYDKHEVVNGDLPYALLESKSFGSANNNYSTIMRFYKYKDKVLRIEFVCESYQWTQFNKIARTIMDSFTYQQ